MNRFWISDLTHPAMKLQILISLLVAPLLIAAEPSKEVPLWQQMQTAVLVNKNIEEVRHLLDAGFDPNGSIGCGDYSAIDGAVQIGNVEMAKLLLERGAKVPDEAMEQVCNTSALDLDMPRLLLQYKGNVNAGGIHSTCLHSAVWHKNETMVRFLVESKANLNVVRSDGDLDGTPLMWALWNGATDIAQILLDAGTDLTVKGKSGFTAADIAEDRLTTYRKLQTQIARSKP
jgi:ankyrin repeat protein